MLQRSKAAFWRRSPASIHWDVVEKGGGLICACLGILDGRAPCVHVRSNLPHDYRDLWAVSPHALAQPTRQQTRHTDAPLSAISHFFRQADVEVKEDPISRETDGYKVLSDAIGYRNRGEISNATVMGDERKHEQGKDMDTADNEQRKTGQTKKSGRLGDWNGNDVGMYICKCGAKKKGEQITRICMSVMEENIWGLLSSSRLALSSSSEPPTRGYSDDGSATCR
jgi:hypothetical protein